MQTGQHAHQWRRHGFLAGRAFDAFWDPKVDRIHLPHAVGQRGGPVGGEGQVVLVFTVIAHQLVGSHGPLQIACVEQGLVFVTPAADQCFDGGANDFIEQVALRVTAVGRVGDGRRLAFAKPARQITGQHAGESNRCHHFFANKVLDVFVGSAAERVAVVAIRLARQNNHTVKTPEVVVNKLHRPIHRFAPQRIKVRQLDFV